MSRKNIVILIGLIVLVTAAVVSARWFQRRNDSTLQGSGTVEARYIRVGSKVGGRIDHKSGLLNDRRNDWYPYVCRMLRVGADQG